MFHHFLLIPYPAQGHIHPALHLAKRLIALGAHVTLSTTLHVHRRMTKKPVNIPGLTFMPFSDGHDGGFSASDESDYALYVSELNRRGSEFITNLIIDSSAQKGHPFTCVVYTMLQTWVSDVARGFQIPMAVLWVQPATVFDIFYYYFHGYADYINYSKAKESSCFIELPGLPLIAPCDLPSFLLPSSSSMNSLFLPMFEKQFYQLDIETNARVLINTFEALETEALRVVDDKIHMIIPIGPLIPLDSTAYDVGDIFHISNGNYVEWLDSKLMKSVIYVSFGSVCVLSDRETDGGNRTCLWVIREKENNKLQEEGKAELEQKGKIVEWCSQVEVLSHGSLGCFLTHCGWNSTVESIVSGVPVVAFPQLIDQKTNAKLIEDVWKIGVRVDHEVNEEGIVKAEEIRRCLEVVIGSGEKGEEMRKNAEKWKGLAGEAVKELGGSSERNLRAFLDDVTHEYTLFEGKQLR